MSAGKKYSKTVTDKSGKKRTVYYGAKGYKIAPGTKRGDSYCARSYGQMKKHPAAAKDPTHPCALAARNGNVRVRNRGGHDKKEFISRKHPQTPEGGNS